MSLSSRTLRCAGLIAVSRDGVLNFNDKTQVEYGT